MADNNLSASAEPDVTTPQTYEEQVEGISNLLGDPETDLPADQDEAAAEPSDTEEDDPLGLDVDAEDVEQVAEEEPDGSDPEIKGGRFAPDTAKVTLDDGTVITVAELKRNNLFQRGFTEKTTALAKERETFEAERHQVTQQAQSLNEFRDYAVWYAENFLPKQPPTVFQGDPSVDPHGYQLWAHERDKWLAHAQAFQTFQTHKQGEEQQKAGETQKQSAARLERERAALIAAMPVLKDPVKGKLAWDTMVAGAAEHYGVPAEEVNAVQDHRFALILRDAIAYRRIKAKAPQVQAQVKQKPAMRPGQRAAPTSASSKGRQVRSERLRSTGSFDDGVAALQDFDL